VAVTRRQGRMPGRGCRASAGGRQREGAGRGHPSDADHLGARSRAARSGGADTPPCGGRWLRRRLQPGAVRAGANDVGVLPARADGGGRGSGGDGVHRASLRDVLKTGLRPHAESVLVEHDGVPEKAQVPGPDPRNQPAVDRMQAGARLAYRHSVSDEVHSQRCDGESAVRFSREVARFGLALPSLFVRTAYTFVRADENVGALRERVPWVAHCWGRLMSLMLDAVTPPVGYLNELSLPYLRTAEDLEYVQAAETQHRHAMEAAAYYYAEKEDKNARREGAGVASRPVPPYERPDISPWPKPDPVGRVLTLPLAEEDRMAVNQARKEKDVRVRECDDIPYLMTAGHHAKGWNRAGWRLVPEALDDLELSRGLHVAYPTVLSYYYNRMKGDGRSCL